LGPAGSGKTYRCLTEIRHALTASPDGLPLILVAPKQTTYQLERRLLADSSLPGYSRLHILSFERLSRFVFQQARRSAPEMLDEEGRLMVLRAILSRKRDELKLYRASARLTGFAQQLSLVLRELQRNQLSAGQLALLADQVQAHQGLSLKLHDLAALLRDYGSWLDSHRLLDADSLLTTARDVLLGTAPLPEAGAGETLAAAASPHAVQFPLSLREKERPTSLPDGPLRLESAGLWVDGFTDFSPQELDLLAALLPGCHQATVTFCLGQIPSGKASWLSSWTPIRRAYEECQKRLARVPGAEARTELLPRQPGEGRFRDAPLLRHIEAHWASPQPWNKPCPPALSLSLCANPEAEATLAAREILRHAQAGGRYREITVLVRQLESYHQPIQRVFSRYGIPYFVDRRESVSHHPLAELTRSALRTVAGHWPHDDWFAALKTGLVPAREQEIDRLENEALARGWKGAIWLKPITVTREPELTAWLAGLHRRLLPPFHRLTLALATRQNKPTGPELAQALRSFWQQLDIEGQLESWAAADQAPDQDHAPGSVHTTVWTQMNLWLDNVELAFATDPLPLREWLPILDAGLATLTVGLIPPALDQVLVGAIDRSRNPDVKLALLLGLNESVFPAPPPAAVLLTEADRLELERRNVSVGTTARHHLSRERHHAYTAFTRARERLVLSYAQHDAQGSPLNPSPLLDHLRRLVPALAPATPPATQPWNDSLHPVELIAPLLTALREGNAEPQAPALAASLPAVSEVIEQLRHFHTAAGPESLSPSFASRLYGPVLRTSVSRLEQFAACPFKFFVHSGLRAEERKQFELDAREQGSFQHDVLALFHEQLAAEGKRWRDITPREARDRIGRLASGMIASYRDGLLDASEQTRFLARVMTGSLQDFAEILVGWMREQYRFDPVAVELPFGQADGCPPWRVQAGPDAAIEIFGRIDRVDIWREPGSPGARCVVLDYKSSLKQLDPILLAHGLQLQLLTYLNVLRQWPNPEATFGAPQLVPSGVFYVNLRGKYERQPNRREALAGTEDARKLAYRHTGRFDARALPLLDSRPEVKEGDQFNYRLTKDGQLHKGASDPMPSDAFERLLDSMEQHIRRMGGEIFSGKSDVSPYRKGTTTACDYCDYRPICRMDPWTHAFRVLRNTEAPA
jgi:ATP-dependent helicase/nuclease subunit B